MQRKRRARGSEDPQALTGKPSQQTSFLDSIKNMKKKLAIQNPAYKFFFKDGVVQYRKKGK